MVGFSVSNATDTGMLPLEDVSSKPLVNANNSLLDVVVPSGCVSCVLNLKQCGLKGAWENCRAVALTGAILFFTFETLKALF